jgi:hypothetical protein
LNRCFRELFGNTGVDRIVLGFEDYALPCVVGCYECYMLPWFIFYFIDYVHLSYAEVRKSF